MNSFKRDLTVGSSHFLNLNFIGWSFGL